MAAQQRTEKEDTDFKVPPESSSSSSSSSSPSSSSLNSLLLCSNNDCGLAGSPSTNNMCQKCFDQSSPSPSPSAASSVDDDHLHHVEAPRSSPSPRPPPRRKPAPASPTPLFRREVNRCSGCSRKVGLTGFRCRCGELFCAEHRYSDRHDCGYDYKAAGREAISRENPVIKAAKIVRV